MVSTRGLKLKFSENERVLCYEPDPTKAKVLYDSKVLDVVIANNRGRKSVEYLIHFQGWNSSWDRYVSEEFVLKDTPENRQLQKDLADKSQLQLGAYLYRRERKKHGRKTSERQAPSSDDGSSASPLRMDIDQGLNNTSSSEEESSIDDDIIPIELSCELKEILELDYYLINSKNKLVSLPANPNVVQILENYYQHYMAHYGEFNERNHAKPKYSLTKLRPEDIQRNLKLCGEVLDGIRIYFDFTLTDLLLYKPEYGQVKTVQALYTPGIKNDLENDAANEVQDQILNRKRSLRSNNTTNATAVNPVTIQNGNAVAIVPQENGKKNKLCTVNHNEEASANGSDALSCWKLLPSYVYHQQPPPPCLVYGAVHLSRLFVKLPELLAASNIDEDKLKIVIKHADAIVDFLNDHKEWFGEKHYLTV